MGAFRAVRTWGSEIGRWITHLRAVGRPESTIKLRRYQLQRLAADLGASRTRPYAVTGDDLETWFASHTWARDTRRSYRSAVRSFYGWAHATGRTSHDPAVILAPVRAQEPRPRPAPELAYRRALASAPEHVRLALRLAGEAGLRRGEVAQIHESDVVEDLLGLSLWVHGKGDKLRLVPLPRALGEQLLAACRRGGGWAFPSSTTGGPITPYWIGRQVAGYLPPGVSMHSLRHRFATRAYAASGDLLAVQQLLGHASPATTQRYVAVDADRLRAVMAGAA